MIHYSKVADSVFAQIKLGHKIIEPRINDAVHQQVRIGDLIVIINRQTREEVVAKVVGVLRYRTFNELFAAYPPDYFGVGDVAEAYQEVSRWYGKEAELAHGVLGIKLHVLRKG